MRNRHIVIPVATLSVRGLSLPPIQPLVKLQPSQRTVILPSSLPPPLAPPYSLTIHISDMDAPTNRPRKLYQCGVCAKNGIHHPGFTRRNNLTRHMETSHPVDKPPLRFHCSWLVWRNGSQVECGHKGTQKGNVDEHINRDQSVKHQKHFLESALTEESAF